MEVRVLTMFKVSYITKGSMALTTKQGKEIPLQILTGPEGSRRLRLSDFKTIST
jgi:hypothetical protein